VGRKRKEKMRVSRLVLTNENETLFLLDLIIEDFGFIPHGESWARREK